MMVLASPFRSTLVLTAALGAVLSASVTHAQTAAPVAANAGAANAAGVKPGVAMQAEARGQSFTDDFNSLDRSIWYVSDGWNNGGHQNCTWLKSQVKAEGGMMQLGLAEKKTKDRNYVCGELQTKARFGYGTYEARMKTATGPGLNSAFFTYIGPTDKMPWDEIDFEVLGKNSARVQVNQYIGGKGKNEKMAPVATGADKDFHDYAFIWEPNRLRYFVDGKLIQEVTDKAKIPQNAQKIFFSLWGTDTLKGWMGNFAYNGPVTMSIDRVAYTKLGEDCRFPDSILCKLD